MLWQGRRESENVEDVRGSGGGGRLVLGGGIGTVILVVLYLLLGGDPQALFNSEQAQLPQSAQIDNQSRKFSSLVGPVFLDHQSLNAHYNAATLSRCSTAGRATRSCFQTWKKSVAIGNAEISVA
jgi:predicted metalloprotease